MKVLWFEITTPGRYKSDKAPIGGWQDSLEQIVRTCKNIELVIAFEGEIGMKSKIVDGVKYIPLVPNYNLIDRKIKNPSNAWNAVKKLLPLAVNCINEESPDLIQCFGTEWCYGMVAKYTKIPVVIHFQGCIAPYNDANFPPGYSVNDKILEAGINFKKQWHIWQENNYNKTRECVERAVFESVSNYMGRTEWDKQLVKIFHKDSKYYHVEEALRPSFVKNASRWHPKDGSHKLRIMTTGCSKHWKGMDTLLKTAHVLKNLGVDFEWLVAGNMSIQKEVERKEKMTFVDNNVRILGFTGEDDLQNFLLSSDMYVHTAYIDNSPNSVCEAQFLGLPIIATNVGGISSLVVNDKDGKLVPTNSCYNMAYEIITLFNDKERQMFYSNNSLNHARKRHNEENIKSQLLSCYSSILTSIKK